MDPSSLMAVEILLATIMLVIGFLKLWILRHRRKTTAEKISDCFFILTICISTTVVGGVVYKLSEEIRFKKETNDELLVEFQLFAPRFLKITYIMGCAYLIELFSLKAAFIAFYWGLFQGIDSKRKYALPVSCVIVFSAWLASFCTFIFWQIPIEVNWSEDLAIVIQKAALASLSVNTVTSWLNIGTDLLVMGLPLLIISSLRLRRPEKLALVFIFCMGGLSIAASVTRYAILYPYIKSPPLTTQTIHVLELWGTVEMASGVLAFCLPSLRVLYIRLLGLQSHIQVTQNNSSGRFKKKGGVSRSNGNGTLWTIGGGAIDSDGNRIARNIVVKRTFDVQRETWPRTSDEEMELTSIEDIGSSAVGVAVGEGSKNRGYIDPTRPRGRGGDGFGAYATAEVATIGKGNVSQERLRPATKDQAMQPPRANGAQATRLEDYSDVGLESLQKRHHASHTGHIRNDSSDAHAQQPVLPRDQER